MAEVTQHPVDPEVLAAASTAGGAQTVTEVVSLEIVAGGLELTNDHQAVVLHRAPGATHGWIGTVDPVRVIDARGTSAGWTVTWTADDVDVTTGGRRGQLPATDVHLVPAVPAVVAGSSDGLLAGPVATAVAGDRTLFGAAAGRGAGTYEAGATIGVRLPEWVDAEQVVVEVSFSVS